MIHYIIFGLSVGLLGWSIESLLSGHYRPQTELPMLMVGLCSIGLALYSGLHI